MASFKERFMDVTFTLGKDKFFPEGNDTITLRKLRTKAHITKAGAAGPNELDLLVYGMTPDQMNKLSTQGQRITINHNNTVTVQAGDADGMSVVFTGTITDAWADYSSQPHVPFHVAAQTGLAQALKSAECTSYKGAVDVSTVLSRLANEMGLKFENNGVSKMLSDPYLAGSPRAQAFTAAHAAGCEIMIDDDTLAIWIPGQARRGANVLVSPDTGMIGYPAYTSYGLVIRTLFNPALRFGGPVTVESSIPGANGEWVIYGLNYDLESNAPNGRWDSTIMVTTKALGPIIPSALAI